MSEQEKTNYEIAEDGQKTLIKEGLHLSAEEHEQVIGQLQFYAIMALVDELKTLNNLLRRNGLDVNIIQP